MNLEAGCSIAIETISWSTGEYIEVEEDGHKYIYFPEHYLEVCDKMVDTLPNNAGEYDCDYDLEELDIIAKKHLKDLGYNYDHVA